MRKRIQQLAWGMFEDVGRQVGISPDLVLVEAVEGADVTGEFVMTCPDDVGMRGIVYTSDARMECLTPQFEGVEVKIRYQFHNDGFIEGDILKGEFYIISSQGEYNLSFVASVSKQYADSSVGKVRSLNDFVKLARENFKEAERLFFTGSMKELLKTEGVRERLFYEGMRQGGASGQKVEEFLSGTGKKKKLEFTIGETEASFPGLTEPRREVIELRKNYWGHLQIEVVADADFLVPQKGCLTEEDFIGSVCHFEYDIRVSALHAGRNWGRIHFRTPGCERVFQVCASAPQKEKTTSGLHRDIKENRVKLLSLYIDYRLKRIVTGVWANRTVRILDHLMAVCPDEPLYPLMKAQALLINRQRQEAAWIMDEFKRAHKGSGQPVWGYYLYICTLAEREPSYVDRLTAEIEKLFRKYPDDSLLFWVLLFVKEEYYTQPQRRYRAIEAWVESGHKSPYFYLEAFYLIWQDPYLLGRLDTFAVEVLNWAYKRDAISQDIAISVMNIVPGKRDFNPLLCRILKKCHEVKPSDEMISVICGYLIKGQQSDGDSHKWYALGVERGLRITNLYEAFLLSADKEELENLPKVIQMYFQYNSSLPWQQKAKLLSGIIAGKERQAKIYQKYKKIVRQFATEQMEAGHINEELAVVYEELLMAEPVHEELARRLSGVLFAHRLTCADRSMARLIVLHGQLKEPQVIPLVNGVAYYRAYTSDYVVILEDNRGNRFIDRILYQDKAMFDVGRYIERCLALAPDCFEYVLYHFFGREDRDDAFTKQDESYFKVLVSSERLNEECRAAFSAERIQGAARSGQDRFLVKLLQRTDVALQEPESRRRLITLMAKQQMYDEAYRLIRIYGYAFLPDPARMALLNHAIAAADDEEDAFLTGFAENTFLHGKYSDAMLAYLCRYAQGSTKMLAGLWKKSQDLNIDTLPLEERILTQMLFAADYVPYVEEIYERFYASGGSGLICDAYLSYFSHGYLTRDMVVPGHVFAQLRERYREGKDLNDTCRLALLKFLAVGETEPGRTEKEMRMADALLEEFTGRNLYFSFYRGVGEALSRRYLFHDKYFFAYDTRPGCRVVVRFCVEGEAYREEELKEMYDGMYVLPLLLFPGEYVQYYIVEVHTEGEVIAESGCAIMGDAPGEGEPERYMQLCLMQNRRMVGDTKQLERMMKAAQGMQKVAESVFRLL